MGSTARHSLPEESTVKMAHKLAWGPADGIPDGKKHSSARRGGLHGGKKDEVVADRS